MARFDLNKILIKDYEIDFVKSLNFVQWVGKNLDYEAVLQKNFKDIEFKTTKTNKKDFLKDLVEKCKQLSKSDGIQEVYEIIESDVLEIEKVQSNEIQLLKNKIGELETQNSKHLHLIETQNKVILKYASYFKRIAPELDIYKYEKIMSGIPSQKNLYLIQKMKDEGIEEFKIKKILGDCKEHANKLFNDLKIKYSDLIKHEIARSDFENIFKFTKDNLDFIRACMLLKKAEINVKDHMITTKVLRDLGKVFVRKIHQESEEKIEFGYYATSATEIFGTSSREKVFEEIGITYSCLPGNQVITTLSPNQIIEKFNLEAIRILTEERK